MASLSLSILAPIFLSLPAPLQVVTMLVGGFFSFGFVAESRVEHAHDAQVQKVEVMQARADVEAAPVAAEIARPSEGWTTKPIHPAGKVNTKHATPSIPATPAKRVTQMERELQVSVPVAQEGAIIVNVRENGKIELNKTELDQAELLKNLKRMAAEHKNQSIIIRGDGKVEYSKIVKVIDLCQKAGISNISFATQVQRKK